MLKESKLLHFFYVYRLFHYCDENTWSNLVFQVKNKQLFKNYLYISHYVIGIITKSWIQCFCQLIFFSLEQVL